MSATTEQLQNFYKFAEQRLRNGGCDQTLDELYAEWRACNPTPEERDIDVRAVSASLRDMGKGQAGRPFEEFAAEFRQRNTI